MLELHLLLYLIVVGGGIVVCDQISTYNSHDRKVVPQRHISSLTLLFLVHLVADSLLCKSHMIIVGRENDCNLQFSLTDQL